jgi:Spy/CpxP family protein refolding chaperone
MSRSNPSIALYLLLIFASGVIVGAFGMRVYSPVAAKTAAPEDWRKQYMNEMQSRLKLTPEQATQLNAILDDTKTRAHQAHEAHDNELRQIKSEQSAKVRSILTEEQRPEFDKIRAEREQRAKTFRNH